MFNTDYYTSRYFNQIADLGYTLAKKSDNIEKIKSEYNFYYLLPDYLKMYFVQPFNLSEDEGAATYEMEKIPVLNAAQQLISGQMTKESFDWFLARVSDFQAKAGLLESTEEEVLEQAKYLVIEKTEARLKDLDYKEQLERLKAAYDKYLPERTTWNLALSHGDLCLSNILWIPETKMIKLIDPRGANTTDDLFLDEYYDLAKLSHSIFSNYEVMVYGMGEVPDFAGPGLKEYLEFRGVSLNLLKVYEAALFLSMIPLHSDSPARMEAFKETAEYILDNIGC